MQRTQRRTRVAEERSVGLTRREALAGIGALASLTIVPRHVLGGAGQTAPSDRFRLAGIGVGGVGYGQLQGCEAAGFQIAALCDVDDVYAEKAYTKWPQAKRFRDYREMLDSLDKEIDAVYCGTPDHTHAVITMEALRRKKHVCCVKPLTRTMHECRTVVEKARQMQVATQVTASPNTSEAACRTCERIWAGAIGPVREVHTWSDRPWWPQGMLRPAGEDPVPSTLDWDLWLGPSAVRPFKSSWPEGHLALEQVNWPARRDAVYHPWNFRGWWAFGTGALGDMGCHHVNTPYRALKLEHPVSVSASSTRVLPETAPLASIVTYEFPARGELPPVRLVWYDGGLRPPRPAALGDRQLPEMGTLYVGDEGLMLDAEILPAERARKFASLPRTLPRRAGTWGEWFEACGGGEPAGCHFEWAGLLTEFVLLGNLALRTGERLRWDGDQGRLLGSEAANQLLQEAYREGWSLNG